MQNIRKILRAVFEETALPTNQSNIKVSDFGLIWRCFCKYLQIKIFFKNLALSLFFYLYSPLRKILRAVFEDTALPTNQPTNKISKCLILG